MALVRRKLVFEPNLVALSFDSSAFVEKYCHQAAAAVLAVATLVEAKWQVAAAGSATFAKSTVAVVGANQSESAVDSTTATQVAAADHFRHTVLGGAIEETKYRCHDYRCYYLRVTQRR